jgi:hypothetical protein
MSTHLTDLFIVTDFIELAITLEIDITSRSGRNDTVHGLNVKVPKIYGWLRRFPSTSMRSLPEFHRLAHLIRSGLKSNNEMTDVCQATNPRDLIYGLSAFVQNELDVVPDYNKSVQQVFTETTTAYLELGNLSLLEIAYARTNIPELPSWVVDWTSSPRYSSTKLRGAVAKRAPVIIVTEFQEQADMRSVSVQCLCIRGITVSCVKNIIHRNVIPDYNERERLRQTLVSLLVIGLQRALPDVSIEKAISQLQIAGFAAFGTRLTTFKNFQDRFTAVYETELSLWRRLHSFALGAFRSTLVMEDMVLDRMLDSLVSTDLVVFQNGSCAFNRLQDVSIRPGDELVLFYGAKVPFIIRSYENTGKSILVGPMPMEGTDEDSLMADPMAQREFRLR